MSTSTLTLATRPPSIDVARCTRFADAMPPPPPCTTSMRPRADMEQHRACALARVVGARVLGCSTRGPSLLSRQFMGVDVDPDRRVHALDGGSRTCAVDLVRCHGRARHVSASVTGSTLANRTPGGDDAARQPYAWRRSR